MANKRIDIKSILRNPATRRELMVCGIIATQAREGIRTTQAQAEAAYDKIVREYNDKTQKEARCGTKRHC